MKVLLLGNGFDLAHKLPTAYINFVNTVDFLSRNYTSDTKTAADVFSATELQTHDSFIAECYRFHEPEYQKVELDPRKIQQLINNANSNIWFKYLLSSVNQDINWIDFEGEIKEILRAIQTCMEVKETPFRLQPLGETTAHIMSNFDFFLEDDDHPYYRFRKDYLIEYPCGSKCYRLDRHKIVEQLFAELIAFAEMLQIYLSEFVEKLVQQIDWQVYSRWWPRLLAPDCVITFNYTNTYETLYPKADMFHIHGETQGKIVLGINPDEEADFSSVDTTFLQFKKYFQRVIWKTDIKYLTLINNLSDSGREISVYVMGHSLDATDEDIIKELFGFASQITVMYHNSTALKDYVHRLVELYRKDGFDQLRTERHLTFVSLEDGMPDFLEKEYRLAFTAGFDNPYA